MNEFNDLTIDLKELDIDQLLKFWRWLVPREYKPIQMTKFGDWFFIDSKNKIWMLDLVEGSLNQILNSIEEYNSIKNNDDKRNDWFLENFVLRCVSEGLILKQNECYGWKIHPIIGGHFEFENIKKYSLYIYQSLIAQLFQQRQKIKNSSVTFRLKE